LSKQNEIQRNQLNDKIADLTDLVATEKDARTVWIDNYEKE
jgi:hypothetical protein